MKNNDNSPGRRKTICFTFIVSIAVAMVTGTVGCRSAPKPSDMAPALETRGNGAVDAARIDGEMLDPDPESPFPTFMKTDLAPCTDDGGRPLILLFSAPSCSHCQWVGGVFDLVAGEYADQGLVAAHHYDVETGDDLLTEAVETGIPEVHLSIGKRGDPDGYMPYFNFGCRYHRIGTGYEKEDDLSAEAEEMRRVIEALLP
jgi:thiol-disulfide isomerase/thioredoxin